MENDKLGINNSIEDVREVLKSKNIPFIYHADGHCFIIFNPDTNKRYQYFYTTGRWSRLLKGRKNTTHYWSEGIHDFLENYFNRKFEKTQEKQMTKKLVKLVPYTTEALEIHSATYPADGRIVSMDEEQLADFQDTAEKAYIMRCILKEAYNNAAKEETNS